MTLTLSPTLARRLAITRQRLAGPRPAPDSNGIMDVVRDLGCLQLDPISVVARSHQLVLFSRLGPYNLAHLDTLLWQERQLFEYWAHCASIVLTEDYPIFNHFMRHPGWSGRVQTWTAQNKKLQQYVLNRIRRHGPLPSRHLEEDGIHPTAWVSTGWTSGRNTSRMLDHLWIGGKIMVAGREGIQKLWDLSERCLPDWTPRDRLTEREVVRRAAQRSIQALGVGTIRHIKYHFTRGSYPGLKNVLAELEAEGNIHRAQVSGLPGEWFIHDDDLPLLDDLANGDWHASRRTTLLSPFDNLICDRARTEQLFNFDFRIEIYTPKAKRKYGYYVLPILHGDQIIGRVDPAMDRENERLTLNAVYAEPNAPKSGKPVAQAIEELASFLGANEIIYANNVPEQWKKALR
ncbi:MAG: YcaQ family DNA glycosylase [Chloroflexi bacterium]|nr:YcaQ family DNA glycosylase [Chloroflexota bacterium]